MEISLDELIKWILLQYDDKPTNEQYFVIYRRLFNGKVGEADEQNGDKRFG